MDDNEVKMFGTADEMFAYMARAEQSANEAVHPAQRSIQRGEYVIRPMAQFLIFGYLFDTNDKRNTRQDLFDRGYRTGYWFSDACPEGEEGDAHVVTLWRITQEEFKAAEAIDWETEEIIRSDWGRKMFIRIRDEAANAGGAVNENPSFREGSQ